MNELKIKRELFSDFSGLDISYEQAIKNKERLALKIRSSKIEDGRLNGWVVE